MKKKYTFYMNEKGQLILTLVLVMTVALAIGLSVVQKSLVDVSTSTKVEQSSRAFSAAEAGVEKALRGDSRGVNFLENKSQAAVLDSGLLPVVAAANKRQDPLEYPPLTKEDVAQIWLADPDSNIRLPGCTAIDPSKHAPVCYTQNSLEVYWGNSRADRAAIELTLVFYNGTQYVPRKWYFDHPETRTPPNSNFNQTLPNCNDSGFTVGQSNYKCKVILGDATDPAGVLPSGLMLIRARLLYNSNDQPLAIWAVGTTEANRSLPPQARNIVSTGVSGETQRRVRLFQLSKVVPPYFDYAIFSAGDIIK